MSHEPNTGPAGRRDIRRGVGLGVRIVATVASLAILVGSAYVWSSYRSLQGHVATLGGLIAPKEGWPDVDGQAQNILIVGDDSRAGATPAELAALSTQATDGDNTDTMMLMHVPADGTAASVISFPRDSWVEVPGQPGQHSKLNGLYAIGTQNGGGSRGGLSLLAQGLYSITGLKVDHFVKVGLIGFYRISVALHGVDLCLNEAQNASTDSDAFGSGYSGIDLKQGWNYNVQGKQALAFVRQRHGVPGGDLGRIKRQQYFLRQAFKKVSSAKTLLDFSESRNLINAVGSSLTVDSGLNLIQFAAQMRDLSGGKLKFATIPVAGTPTIYPDGVATSIVALDWAKIPAFVKAQTGATVHPTQTEGADRVGARRLEGPDALPASGVRGGAVAVASAPSATPGSGATTSSADCVD